MGWSVLSKPPAAGWVAYLDDVLAGGGANKVLGTSIAASGLGSDGNYYAAVSLGGDDPRVVAVVAVLEGGAYKIMGEECGPYYWAPPLKVLEALTPTDNPWALKWRERAEVEATRGMESRAVCG